MEGRFGKKKIVGFLIAAFVLSTIISGCSSHENGDSGTEVSETPEYRLSEDGQYMCNFYSKYADIVGYEGAEIDVVVPSSIEGLPVRSVGGFHDETRSVVIPEGVTKITDGAFKYCDLQSITLPNTLVEIGDNAFEECKTLTSIVIPER